MGFIPVAASRLSANNWPNPRLTKPRLGLNSDRCSAAWWMISPISCRWLDPVPQVVKYINPGQEVYWWSAVLVV